MSAVLTRRAALSGAVASVAMVGVAVAGAAAVAPASADHPSWDRALADYTRARAASDACPPNHPDEDDLVDAYCEAMDKLIIDTPAPEWAAVLRKMDFANERQEGFAFVPEYAGAIRADVVRLAGVEVSA